MQDIINMTDVNYSGKIEWPEFAVALAEKLKPDEDDEVSFIIKSIFIKEKILSISELLKKNIQTKYNE